MNAWMADGCSVVARMNAGRNACVLRVRMTDEDGWMAYDGWMCECTHQNNVWNIEW